MQSLIESLLQLGSVNRLKRFTRKLPQRFLSLLESYCTIITLKPLLVIADGKQRRSQVIDCPEGADNTSGSRTEEPSGEGEEVVSNWGESQVRFTTGEEDFTQVGESPARGEELP